jgi:uncharacterized protein
MKTEHIPLPSPAPGANFFLTVHRFGEAGRRPCAYIQAALHAGEIPPMLAAHFLREKLTVLEAAGNIAGEIILVPSANPIGLGQKLLGSPIGRFNLADGVNFNRNYPHVVEKVSERIKDSLTSDGEANVRAIREAMRAEVDAWQTSSPAEALKKVLLGLAIEADLVLDLHCDAEAIMHLYTHPRSAERVSPLAALLRAEAVLLAEESGGDPFDEANSRPWAELATRFPQHPIPFGCHSCTVELRGETDVNEEFARNDAAAIIDFLLLRGLITGPKPTIPPPSCAATPLAGSEPITAPASGIIVFKATVGARLKAGDIVAELIDPVTGLQALARTTTDGVLFARVAVRFAIKGQTLAKVAGAVPRRTGNLLTA